MSKFVTSEDLLAFIMRVLTALEDDMYDAIFWRTDDEYAPVTFLVNCNDLFYWACADVEAITPENVGELEKAIADAKAADPDMYSIWARELFCCRVRKMRPQPPCYKHYDKYPGARALFDACGPERNPKECG